MFSTFSFPPSHTHQEATAYLQLARAWNLVPSVFLVLAGGVAAAPSAGVAPAVSALTHGRLWAAAAATGAIALGSMVVNDFFDRVADAVNAPHKPLPSGRVPPDGALVFGGGLYLATLVATAWMEPAALRFLVAGSAGVTLTYTPLLKRVPGLKTASVAAVIAAAPAAGAIAVTGGAAGIAVAAPAVAFAFAAVSHRELLMDATDAAGDAAAGVATLPVLLGETGGGGSRSHPRMGGRRGTDGGRAACGGTTCPGEPGGRVAGRRGGGRRGSRSRARDCSRPPRHNRTAGRDRLPVQEGRHQSWHRWRAQAVRGGGGAAPGAGGGGWVVKAESDVKNQCCDNCVILNREKHDERQGTAFF